jgi:hypothetical protein
MIAPNSTPTEKPSVVRPRAAPCSPVREHGRLKTEAGNREVILAAPIVRLLRNCWLESNHKGADGFVFLNTAGRPHNYRRVGPAFRTAVEQASVQGAGRMSLHSLRHGCASMRIGSGLDVVFVSRQLGHANPNVTLRVYAHVFARREHADRARAALSITYAGWSVRASSRINHGVHTERTPARSTLPGFPIATAKRRFAVTRS